MEALEVRLLKLLIVASSILFVMARRIMRAPLLKASKYQMSQLLPKLLHQRCDVHAAHAVCNRVPKKEPRKASSWHRDLPRKTALSSLRVVPVLKQHVPSTVRAPIDPRPALVHLGPAHVVPRVPARPARLGRPFFRAHCVRSMYTNQLRAEFLRFVCEERPEAVVRQAVHLARSLLRDIPSLSIADIPRNLSHAELW